MSPEKLAKLRLCRFEKLLLSDGWLCIEDFLYIWKWKECTWSMQGHTYFFVPLVLLLRCPFSVSQASASYCDICTIGRKVFINIYLHANAFCVNKEKVERSVKTYHHHHQQLNHFISWWKCCISLVCQNALAGMSPKRHFGPENNHLKSNSQMIQRAF